MNKLKVLVLFSIVFLALGLGIRKSHADNVILSDNAVQDVNDEGYGKDDVEYNNSEDEQMNVDEPLPGENANSQ